MRRLGIRVSYRDIGVQVIVILAKESGWRGLLSLRDPAAPEGAGRAPLLRLPARLSTHPTPDSLLSTLYSLLATRPSRSATSSCQIAAMSCGSPLPVTADTHRVGRPRSC